MILKNSQAGLFAAILLLTVCSGILYIIFIPPWQSPDEPTHFEYAWVLAEGAPPWAPRLRPDMQEEIIVSLDRYDYWRYVGEERPRPLPVTFRDTPFLFAAPTQIGKNPPLYYLLTSFILRIDPASSIEARLYRLRALSLLFTLITVCFVWACAREIFGSSSLLGPAAAGITAFLPQFMAVGTSVSPDPLTNLFGAGAIYLVIRYQRTGLNVPKLLLLLLWHGVGLLVNYKCLILCAALPGVVLVHLLLQRDKVIIFKRLLLWTGLTTAIILLAYSCLVWNVPEVARVFIIRINILCTTIASYVTGKTLFPLNYWSWFNTELFKSFWLKYGWLKFELPGIYYTVFKLAGSIALGGIILSMVGWITGRSRIDRNAREQILTLLLYALVTVGAYYLFWGLRVEAPTTQGRHLFLVMPSWTILFLFGWRRFFPVRWEWIVGLVLLLGFFLLNVIALFGYIMPTFQNSL